MPGISLIAEGLSNQQIDERLFITAHDRKEELVACLRRAYRSVFAENQSLDRAL
jgi:hypothetical protein